MNGGFGMVLDGSPEAHLKAESMLNWDVSNGVARRYLLCTHLYEGGSAKFILTYKTLGAGVETRMRRRPFVVPWRKMESSESPCLIPFWIRRSLTEPCHHNHLNDKRNNTYIH